MPQILHIIVNYRNNEETKSFVKKCSQLKSSDHVNFCIVNNSAEGPKDDSFQKIEIQGLAKILNFSDNPGYFNGAFRAFETLEGSKFDFVILSNSDLQILSPNFYEKLLTMKLPSDVAAIAPSVRSELTKQESNPLYLSRPKVSKIRTLKLIYSFFPLAWTYHTLSWLKHRFTTAQTKNKIPSMSTIYSPHGCFLILTRSFFNMGGTFLYPVRLYGEEIFLAEQVRNMKMRILLLPELKISHREKGTEVKWAHRVGLSKRTFEFKKEAAHFMYRLFQDSQ